MEQVEECKNGILERLSELESENLMSRLEGTIGSNQVRANLHELVPEPGLWERIILKKWNIVP